MIALGSNIRYFISSPSAENILVHENLIKWVYLSSLSINICQALDMFWTLCQDNKDYIFISLWISNNYFEEHENIDNHLMELKIYSCHLMCTQISKRWAKLYDL